VKLITLPDRNAWLCERRRGLGGSDVPAVIGISPWRTPLQVWAEKVGLETSPEESYTLRRGSHMEGLIAGELEREIEETDPAGKLCCSVDWTPGEFRIVEGPEPWMRYSPDAFGSTMLPPNPPSAQFLAEFKSHPRGASEWEEGPPPHVLAQVQWGMHVCDMGEAYVAVDLGTEFRWARVERDPSWWPAHEGAIRAFWRLVETETAPEPTGDEGDKATLLRMFPRETEGKAIGLPVEMLDDVRRLDELAAQAKATRDEMDLIQNRVRAAMGDAERATLIDGSGFTYRAQERAEHMVKASSSRVLRRVARKEK